MTFTTDSTSSRRNRVHASGQVQRLSFVTLPDRFGRTVGNGRNVPITQGEAGEDFQGLEIHPIPSIDGLRFTKDAMERLRTPTMCRAVLHIVNDQRTGMEDFNGLQPAAAGSRRGRRLI